MAVFRLRKSWAEIGRLSWRGCLWSLVVGMKMEIVGASASKVLDFDSWSMAVYLWLVDMFDSREMAELALNFGISWPADYLLERLNGYRVTQVCHLVRTFYICITT